MNSKQRLLLASHLVKVASYAFELLEQARKESPDNPKAWLESRAAAEPGLALDVAKAIDELENSAPKPSVGRTIARTATGALGGLGGLAAGTVASLGADSLNESTGSKVPYILMQLIQGGLIGGGLGGGAYLGRNLIPKA